MRSAGAVGAARATLVASAAVVAVVVAACATLPPGALDRTIHGSTIEGRMSVRYRDLASGKSDVSSGRFVWTVDGERLELSLLDPLGQTVALIRSEPGRATIAFRDGRRVEGASPAALTESTLGWAVPLAGLRDWLDGRPAAASVAVPTGDGGIRQDGWTIRFERDDGAPANAPPKRVDCVYPGPPASIDLRLVVDARSAG